MSWAVFGIIYSADGLPAGGVRMNFRPAEWRARAKSFGVVTRGDVITTTTVGSGFFRVTLTPGKHYLWIGSSRRVAIEIPETPGEYLLPDLLGVTSVPPEQPANFRESNGVRQLINATTGGWHTVAVTGAFDAYRTAFAADGPGITGPNFRYRDGMVELAHFDLGTWHAPILQSGNFFLVPDGSTGVANDRVNGGLWHLRDIVTGAYRSWWITGAPGAETLSFGPETT